MNFKKIFSGVVCTFRGHVFDMPEIRFDCLYFCRRGCGHEYAGRTLDDLRNMPYVSADEMEKDAA